MTGARRVSRIKVWIFLACIVAAFCANSQCHAQSLTPVVTVNAPAVANQNQPVSFAVSVSGVAEEPVPTGTVTLTDSNSGNTIGPVALADGTANITTSSLPTGYNPYSVQYTGDDLYNPGYFFGDIFIQAGLIAVHPAAITAGSPATGVRLTGNGFTASSVAQLIQSGAPINLTTTFVNASELRAVIPAANLAANGTLKLQVLTAESTTNQLPITAYTKYSDQVSVSGNFPSLTYGQAHFLNLTGSVTRGATTDAAVPSGTVSFLLNGTSFGSAQLKLANAPVTTSYLTGSPLAIDSQPAKLLAADVNRDGFTDVIGYPYYGGSYLQLFLAAGANSFLPETEIYTACHVQDFAIGDLNRDGTPDIVVACNNSENSGPSAVYLLGNGNGSFQTPVAFATSDNSSISSPTQIAAGDFNGDGVLDVALIDSNGNLQVFTGSQPFGTFTALPATTFPALPIESGSVVNAVAADFNQDGKSDLALLEYGYTCECPATGVVVVLTSAGNGTFRVQQQSFNTPANNSLQALAVTDVNGDGYPDVAVADPGLPGSDTDTGQVLIYENDGTGQLNPAFVYAAPNAITVVGAPFPVTGKPAAASQPPWSLFFASYNPDTTAIQLISLRRLSAKEYSELYSNSSAGYTPYSDGGFFPIAMVAGDWNGDGYLNLILNAQSTANNSSNSQVTPVFFGADSAATLAGLTTQPNAGTYAVTAAYPGDVYFAGGNSTAITFIVNKASSTAALAGSPNPATFGQSVTLTATITGVKGGSPPTGTVQFYADGNSLGVVAATASGAAASTAHITTASLAVGTHRIAANYSGDVNYLTSAAGASTVVNPATLTLNLTSSATSVTAGLIVEFDVQANGSDLPVGQPITFTGLPTSAATPTLDSTGRAVYRFGLFTPGPKNIQAHFGGTPSFAAADSNTVTLNVTATPVTVSLASSENPVTYPGTFNLTATATSGGLGIPTGTVTFQDNGAAIGTGTMAVVNGASGFSLTGNFDATSGSIIAVATGDFNKDGKPDLAVLQQSPNNVTTLSISLGNGDGTFADPVTYTATKGVDPFSSAIAVGDFNKDGYSDLAILSSDSLVTILLADADGSGTLVQHQPPIQLPVAGAIAVGDFNGDGNPDIAVVGSAAVSVFLGAGAGTTVFPQAPSFQYTGEFSPTGMVAADFNQDGYYDLAISNSPGTVTVLLYNRQTGNFNAQSYPAGESATAIAAGNFSGHKYPDIAVVSSGDSTVAILYTLENGDFTPGVPYATSGEPVAITSGDFNGDGYTDFAISGIAGGPGGGTTILFGAPISSPASYSQTSEALISGAFGQAITSADFNGDGHPDLGIALNGVAAYVDSAAQFAINNVALPVGTHPLGAVYTPAGETTFAPATSGILSEVVNRQALTLVSINPTSGLLGDSATTITLNGTGFAGSSVAELNGATISTNFISQTQLQATIPASYFQKVQNLAITVTDPETNSTTTAVEFSVTAPEPQGVLSGPTTGQPEDQPTVTFQLQNGYPVNLTGTFTLSVQPATAGGPVDPNVTFINGTDTSAFTLLAGSTEPQSVQLRTGTIAGTITVTVTLMANETDVTPESLQPLVIQVPPAVPHIDSLVLTRSGKTLTVTIGGYSNTREMKSALFHFTAASGSSLENSDLTVNGGTLFGNWYEQSDSDQYGSTFTYVQTFILSADASTIGTVSATLVNSVGNSNTGTAQ